jgi:hypothetical protein
LLLNCKLRRIYEPDQHVAETLEKLLPQRKRRAPARAKPRLPRRSRQRMTVTLTIPGQKRRR